MPENHTKELINLYGIKTDETEIKPHGITFLLGGGSKDLFRILQF